MKRLTPLCLLLSVIVLTGCEKQVKPILSYHFDQPAQLWEETFPLGNGRIGLMPDGGIEQESILLNEISLWSGSMQNTDNPEAIKSLPEIRQLLFEGRNDEAQQLMYDTFVCGGQGSAHGNGAYAPYGSSQLVGYLNLDFSYPDAGAPVSEYRRSLNLEEAVSTLSFMKGDIRYNREYFTSFSEDVGIVRLTADREKALRFGLSMNRPECVTVTTDGRDLVLKGRLSDGVDTLEYKGMPFEARVRVLMPQGGTLTPAADRLEIADATEVILLVSMGTDYFREYDFINQTTAMLDRAEAMAYQPLRDSHTEKYAELFDRVELDLGLSGREEMPIDERLSRFAVDGQDVSLATLYFQFGRYLLISSTRPGLLPPNLQGLWTNRIRTPWNGDYHLNINLQMNHWPAEVTNLSELHLPLVEWTKQQVRSGRRTAKVFYNARGWVTHILGNVWEFTAPGEHPSWGATNTSAAWLCQHLYEHYLYTLDKEYLTDVYPVMKEAALFFVDMLVEDPRNGYLVTAPTTSPENAFIMENGRRVSIVAGSTMDNQILRELFTNTIEAASLLRVDEEFSKTLKAKRERLMPTTIGPDGRIMEWLAPYKEAEPQHRHVSHLYGLHPGNEISVLKTPELAEAARRSLEARGDKSTGWSMAWKMNFWARLHDGNHAFKLLTELLQPCVDRGTNMTNGGGTYPNLFCAHPPFQIDGNFGGCAGIAEMLLQSQSGLVEILPALPTAWPSGSFRGLKVRGGGEVAAEWAEGKLTTASLKAIVSGRFAIKIPADSENLIIKKNNKIVSMSIVDSTLTIDLQEGEEVVLLF
ncbi:alpha-L-fucosidase 2 [Parabacteroides sp. PFB2-10]|uniref:glycoside hydrolase family 95 protein n=1 Tax=Parabacteroides sp. PFB2-10 TaxID=1742405 RepID=UPI002475D54F|nr:glycoside hydrolase family 95 protein [Parabacteroides sp. PFB2-10]MDH6313456.1 alpha-L-fucosidase 2 [Parabacteroides sp. PFB2-10]MDL2245747.1 glycoside hydrolase family 95 protein [Parabacteroides sp. OttesenSCG-928-J18]